MTCKILSKVFEKKKESALTKKPETVANNFKQAAKSASDIIATRRGYSTKRVKGMTKNIKPHDVDSD